MPRVAKKTTKPRAKKELQPVSGVYKVTYTSPLGDHAILLQATSTELALEEFNDLLVKNYYLKVLTHGMEGLVKTSTIKVVSACQFQAK